MYDQKGNRFVSHVLGSIVSTNEDIEFTINQLELHGTDSWYRLPPSSFTRTDIAGDVVKSIDTLDVWLDSGLSWNTLPRRDNGIINI